MFAYLFNPDNDLALGNNSRYYQAPASALKMAADLAVLPIWFAPEGNSLVLVPYPRILDSWMKKLPLCPDVKITSLEEWDMSVCDELLPWGWNVALLRKLEEIGVFSDLLPSSKQVEHWRTLSSRLYATDVLTSFSPSSWLCGVSCACRSLEEVKSMVTFSKEGTEWNVNRKFLKAPWSSSGKGLRWGEGKLETSICNWCQRILLAQQVIMVEPYYDKVKDFAMEFYSDGYGIVSFVGYSLFQTDANGAYQGNVLCSDLQIQKLLEQYVPEEELISVKLHLEKQLSLLFGNFYKGYLGVDMMICYFGEYPFYRLHPCVEINMRMNMGVVAHSIYNRWVSLQSEGIFKVEFFKTSQALQENHEREQKIHPLIVEDGRAKSGYFVLTPVGNDTLYRAAMWICPINE